MLIVLPLPNPCLQPNRVMRVHWSKRHKAAKKAREDAALVARDAKPDCDWPNGVTIRATFYYRNRRSILDQDGAIGYLKAYQDGIADALGIDDSRFHIAPPVQKVDKSDPRVEIEVEPHFDRQ